MGGVRETQEEKMKREGFLPEQRQSHQSFHACNNKRERKGDNRNGARFGRKAGGRLRKRATCRILKKREGGAAAVVDRHFGWAQPPWGQEQKGCFNKKNYY